MLPASNLHLIMVMVGIAQTDCILSRTLTVHYYAVRWSPKATQVVVLSKRETEQGVTHTMTH